MDSEDEEALTALLDEEAKVDVQEQEHLMVLAALTGLLASNEKPQRGGSAPGRVKAKKTFRRCCWMSQKLFLRIVNSIWEFDNYFKCKKDCTGTLGFTSIRKCTTAMRMQGSGDSAQVDHQLPATWTAFLNMCQEIRDPQVHQQL